MRLRIGQIWLHNFRKKEKIVLLLNLHGKDHRPSSWHPLPPLLSNVDTAMHKALVDVRCQKCFQHDRLVGWALPDNRYCSDNFSGQTCKHKQFFDSSLTPRIFGFSSAYIYRLFVRRGYIYVPQLRARRVYSKLSGNVVSKPDKLSVSSVSHVMPKIII